MRIKAILIAPPGADFSPLAPLGIAQLRGFLESLNYRHLKVIDLRYARWERLKISIIKLSARIGIGLQFLKQGLVLRLYEEVNHRVAFLQSRNQTEQPQDGWASSLRRIVNQAMLYDVQLGCTRLKLNRIQGRRLIGFSIVYPKQLYYALTLSRFIKRHHPGSFIVMGGPQVSKHINFLKGRQDLTGVVDGFVVRDGEEPLAELIYQLETSNRLEKVPNLFYWDDDRGYCQSSADFNADNTYLVQPNFDSLHFAFIPIRTSYGCPWGRCTFCTYHLLHPQCSQGTAAQIVGIIKSLERRYRVANFRLIDDFLTPAFLDQFAAALLDQKISIRWWCFVALVPGMNTAICDRMQQAGCQSVYIGLESMSVRILTLMQKPHTPTLAHDILKQFKNTTIKICLFILCGFPTETEDEASLTLDYLKRNAHLYDRVEIQQFCLEEDTDIYVNPDKYGITKIYRHDKNVGLRIGYRYEVSCGMNLVQADRFAKRARAILAGKRKLVAK